MSLPACSPIESGFTAHVVTNELFGQHYSEGLAVHCSGRDVTRMENICIPYCYIKKETKDVLIVYFILEPHMVRAS